MTKNFQGQLDRSKDLQLRLEAAQEALIQVGASVYVPNSLWSESIDSDYESAKLYGKGVLGTQASSHRSTDVRAETAGEDKRPFGFYESDFSVLGI
jgi:hypothetical protein